MCQRLMPALCYLCTIVDMVNFERIVCGVFCQHILSCVFIVWCLCRQAIKGVENMGNMTHTINGQSCWTNLSYTFQHFDDASFPEGNISASKNQCRNPDGMRERPWCFTGNPPADWGVIAILRILHMFTFGIFN